MAKRKRKMTLFDVMHSGQSVGLQVRTRVQPHHPTPELPVMKKLSKLFGKTRKPDANRPTSAAEELAQLRRELAGKTSAEPAPAADEFSPEPTPTFRTAEPIAEAFSPHREEPQTPREPAVPKRSLGDVLNEQWAVLSPKLAALALKLKSFCGQSAQSAARGLLVIREYASRYAVTAGAALGVVVLLCGSFYAGKLLFNRPSTANLSGSTIAGNDVRPDVLDINDGSGTHANEPIANINAGQPETTLERRADPPTPKPGVFGGRKLDQNYLVIQSYPTQTEAVATVDVLAKYGINSTVELNLPKWAGAGTTLYSVVSLEGFQKLTGNETYAAFQAKIAKISENEKDKTIKKSLVPGAYKWAGPTTP